MDADRFHAEVMAELEQIEQSAAHGACGKPRKEDGNQESTADEGQAPAWDRSPEWCGENV
jgi:hypothetical protein